VGEAEDRIMSMFSACLSSTGKAILILDDAEHFLGTSGDEGSPTGLRCKRTFLSALDNLRDKVPEECAVLVLCTSKENSAVLTWRFDVVFYLELPQDDARKEILIDLLDIREQLDADKGSTLRSLRDLLVCVVASTAGRSYAEIIMCCRQALTSVSDAMSPADFSFHVLVCMKDRLTSMTPASLRDGALDDYVDMRILSARDLSPTDQGAEFVVGEGFPFRGSAAADAWKELQATIAIPLCRSRELDDILDRSGSGTRRALAGGILLAGPPCSGKSALALHCAKYAAWLSSSVKLLGVSCTSLIHKELGGSERAVHHLFAAARRASPCVIIMDGLENVAAVRGNDPTTEGTLDRVLSTMLVELDGADDVTNSQHCSIAIIGITCNELWIDPAMKRPGRLGKTSRLDTDWE
jgi:SpoVK/Ycf46/Vps4 family AAA+-type ATPase